MKDIPWCCSKIDNAALDTLEASGFLFCLLFKFYKCFI